MEPICENRKCINICFKNTITGLYENVCSSNCYKEYQIDINRTEPPVINECAICKCNCIDTIYCGDICARLLNTLPLIRQKFRCAYCGSPHKCGSTIICTNHECGCVTKEFIYWFNKSEYCAQYNIGDDFIVTHPILGDINLNFETSIFKLKPHSL